MRRRLALLLPLLAFAAAVLPLAAAAAPRARAADPAPAQPSAAYRAAVVLAKGEAVYVDPSQQRIFSRVQADQVRGKIIRVGGSPIYVAVLPGNAASNEGDRQLKELVKLLNPGFTRKQTIAVVTGGRLRAASTAIPYAKAEEFADQAIAANDGEPLEVTISDFIGRVGKEEGRSESGGVGGVITGVVLTFVVFGGGGILLLRRRRRWRELARVRPLVEDDMTALARELLAFSEPEATSVRVPLERASRELKKARGVEHLPRIAAELATARRALAVARSALAGEVPAPDRPACLFDPRHGASAFDVEWTPPGGAAPRVVPACAVDAQRVKNGLAPVAREVEAVEGQLAPWFDAGPEFRYYLAPASRDLLAGLAAGAPLRPSRWRP